MKKNINERTWKKMVITAESHITSIRGIKKKSRLSKRAVKRIVNKIKHKYSFSKNDIKKAVFVAFAQYKIKIVLKTMPKNNFQLSNTELTQLVLLELKNKVKKLPSQGNVRFLINQSRNLAA